MYEIINRTAQSTTIVIANDNDISEPLLLMKKTSSNYYLKEDSDFPQKHNSGGAAALFKQLSGNILSGQTVSAEDADYVIPVDSVLELLEGSGMTEQELIYNLYIIMDANSYDESPSLVFKRIYRAIQTLREVSSLEDALDFLKSDDTNYDFIKMSASAKIKYFLECRECVDISEDDYGDWFRHISSGPLNSAQSNCHILWQLFLFFNHIKILFNYPHPNSLKIFTFPLP